MERILGGSVGCSASWSGFVADRLADWRHGADSWRLGWLCDVMEQIRGRSAGSFGVVERIRGVSAGWVGGVAQLVWRREAACWWYVAAGLDNTIIFEAN
uniref:Uncharacterized protein n=1 Tax=Caenorhabditis japonica TaxID=281687 RepID=A0A2Q4T005_CAEJA